MREQEERREEKLGEREICLGSSATARRPERQHGKLYRWLDNYWYHHKWKTIAALFAVLVITVCTAQMCSKEAEGDLNVVMAGPYSFTAEDNAYGNLTACLSNYLDEDYDGSGEKKVKVVNYTIFSADQIKALSDTANINVSTNSQTYKSFFQYISVGDTAVFFLDPWLFEELSQKPEYLMDLDATLGYHPKGAVSVTQKDGSTKVLGVRLGDTALYQNKAMQVLPEDTVICLLAPLSVGNINNPEQYAKSVAYVKSLTDPAQ